MRLTDTRPPSSAPCKPRPPAPRRRSRARLRSTFPIGHNNDGRDDSRAGGYRLPIQESLIVKRIALTALLAASAGGACAQSAGTGITLYGRAVAGLD